jgi:virulence-associated protein VagC
VITVTEKIKEMLAQELKWFPMLAEDRVFQAAMSLITTIETQDKALEISTKRLMNIAEEKNAIIESQKEEIEKWRKMYGQERQFSEKFQQERDEAVKKYVFWENHCGNSELRIESQKAITEQIKEVLSELYNQLGQDMNINPSAKQVYLSKLKFVLGSD